MLFNLFGYFSNTKKLVFKTSEGYFLVFFSSLILYKQVIKAREKLLCSLFIINQYFTRNVILQKMCSKQAQGCFLVYYATFNLFSDFCNTKNVCLKQVKACFLIYLDTFLIQKCVFKTSRRLLFNLFGYFSNTEKRVFKTSVRLLFNLFGCFSNTKTCVQNKREAAFNLFGYFSNTRKCVFKTSGGERWEMLLNLLPNFQKGLQSNLPLYRLYPGIPFIFTPFAWQSVTRYTFV